MAVLVASFVVLGEVNAQEPLPPFSARLRYALQLMQDSNYATACPILDTLCRLNDMDRACSWLIECHIKAGNLNPAKKTLREAPLPPHISSAYSVAISYLQKPESRRVRKQITRLAKNITGSYQQVREVLDVWERLGLYRVAIHLIEMGDNETRSALRLDKARLHIKAGDTETAVKEYILAIVENKGMEGAAAQELVRLCRNDTAVAQLVEKYALRWLDAFPTPEIARLLALAWENAGDIGKAIYYARLYDRRFHLGGTVLLDLATRLLSKTSTTPQGMAILAELVSEGNLSTSQQALAHLAAYLENSSDYLTRAEIQKIWERISGTLARLPSTASTNKTKLSIYTVVCERLQECKPLKSFALQLLRDPTLPTGEQVRARLALARALVFEDSLWSALRHLLLAEKQATGAQLEEVQLRLGLSAYFMGDFELARLQLDKVRGATEQLTANDAIYLSTLIHETLHEAGSEPLRLFARAHLCALRGDTQCTFRYADTLTGIYYWTHLATESLWLRGLACWRAGNLTCTIENYQKLLEVNPSAFSADRTAYHLIQILYRQNLKQQATDIYLLLEDHHPSSVYTNLARNLLTPALPR